MSPSKAVKIEEIEEIVETEEVILSPEDLHHEEYEITSVPIETTTTVQTVKRTDIRDLAREAHYQAKLLQQENEGNRGSERELLSQNYFDSQLSSRVFRKQENLSKSIA